jgi:glycine/D-amino acid oxidase-like deaminating enzyme
VCVIGLGASGLAAVLEARALGRTAVGIDAGVIAGGAAGRNGGFVLAGLAPFHHQVRHPNAAALYRATLDEVARTPTARQTGSLRLPVDDAEHADCERQLAAMHADGLPVEWEDGALLFPRDACVHPVERALALASGLDDLYEHTPALDITGTRVSTPDATVSCGAVVVAVDGFLERVLPELRGRVRTARAQMLATAPLAEHRFPRPVYARWGYDYWQQRPDGRLMLGGCRDRFAEDEWDVPPVPTAPVQGALERLLRDVLRVDAPITHRWAGSIAFTDDGLPVLEEVRPRVWAAGAYSGTGNVVGVLNARAALRRAIGEPSEWADLLEH